MRFPSAPYHTLPSFRRLLPGGLIAGGLLLAAGCSFLLQPEEEPLPTVGLGTLLLVAETNIDGNDFMLGDLAWSQDSKEVLYSGGTYGTEGEWVRRVDITTGQVNPIGDLNSVTDFREAPGSGFLVVAGNSGDSSALYLATPAQYNGLSLINAVVSGSPVAWSTDATLLAFAAGRTGTYGTDLQTSLVVRNIPADSVVLTVQVAGEAFPLAFSFDADRLLFGERRYDPVLGSSDTLFLFIYDAVAQTTQFVESLPYVSFRQMRAHWDAAGFRLVYWPGQTDEALVIYAQESGSTLVLSQEGVVDGWSLAAVSHDFRKAALWFHEATFAGDDGFSIFHRTHLYVVDLESGDRELIANGSNQFTGYGGVAFSPDGLRIAYLYAPVLLTYNSLNLYFQSL